MCIRDSYGTDPPLVTSWSGASDDPLHPTKETAVNHVRWSSEIHVSETKPTDAPASEEIQPADPFRRQEFDERFPPLDDSERQMGRDAGTPVRTDITVREREEETRPGPAGHAADGPLQVGKYSVPDDDFFHPHMPTYFAPWDEANDLHGKHAATCAMANEAAVLEAENALLKTAAEEQEIWRMRREQARQAEQALLKQLAAEKEKQRIAELLRQQAGGLNPLDSESRGLRYEAGPDAPPAEVYRSAVKDYRREMSGQARTRHKALARTYN
eukprot:TRINITY_DN13532_c0_g1_i2.p1 TRINITY_DN13532_c0_g1~~TRINITY_DN13532_c0_g1_i2.p1  ORF type:complete len:271 (+),score=59.09 TRINITY_DN13532_c0_g1_i2:126-938(+)